MTPTDQAMAHGTLIGLLERVLPPILRNERPLFKERVCVDLEWDDYGQLDCIGVGNAALCTQLWWKEIDDESRRITRAWLQELLLRVPVVIQNADGDIRKLRSNGFPIFGPANFLKLDDPMLAHAALHSEEEHTLEYLNGTLGSLPDYKHLRTVVGAESVYNAADLVSTCIVMDKLDLQLGADPGARFAYESKSLPFLWIAIESEEAGIRVHPDTPIPLYQKYDEKRQQATRLARAYAGVDLNLNSPDEMKHLLYNIESMPVQRKRAAWGEQGAPTTDKDAIAALRRLFGTEWDEEESPTLEQACENIEDGGHPLLEARYLHMGAQQAISHYIAPCLVEKRTPRGDQYWETRERIYPECRQHVQASGRHSYVAGNHPEHPGMALQQLKGSHVPDPLHSGGTSPELLTLITPDVGTVWVGHDWSNIETWLLGVLAKDEVILEAKRLGWDTHTVNFCDATGTPRPPVLTKTIHSAKCSCGPVKFLPGAHAEQYLTCPAAWREKFHWAGGDDLRRTFFKRYVYRLHYRGKPENCGDIPGAKSLGFDVTRLIASSNLYLGKHPAIPVFWGALEAQVDRENLVRTWAGRPRRLTGAYRGARIREASNHPLQGGTSEIYIETALLVKAAAPWARLVFGAHDSMWWQVPAHRMLEFLALYVPIVERDLTINGQVASFPAEYKLKRAA